jgi:hypothetical protein
MTNTHPSQIRGSQFHAHKFCTAFGVIGLALLGASQVQAGPSANGAVHTVTGMANANYHATKNCGEGVTVMTPQPGTDLMPIDDSNVPPEVDTLYRRAARQHVTWIDTVECQQTHKTSAISSPIWSGYQIGGYAAPANHYVSSGWYVPAVYAPAYSSGYNNGYYSCIWSGLGGGYNRTDSNDYAHPLIQAGTEQDISNGTTDYYFWYEIFPVQQYQVRVTWSTMAISPGDDVAAGVFWVPGSNTAVLGMCDWNTNRCVNFNVPNIGEPSNTTEWVVEATQEYGVAQPLPNFSPIHFYNATWATTTTYSTTSESGIPGPITGQAAPAITGSVTTQPMAVGPSLTELDMYLPSPYSSTSPIIARPGPITSSQYGGSDFYVYHN